MPNPENIIGKGFDVNKQNINRKGAPRKLVSTVIKDLEEQGITRVNKAEVRAITELFFNLIEDDMKNIVKDTKTPLVLRSVAKGLLSGKGYEIFKDLLDRAHGRPAQEQNITGNIKTSEKHTIFIEPEPETK